MIPSSFAVSAAGARAPMTSSRLQGVSQPALPFDKVLNGGCLHVDIVTAIANARTIPCGKAQRLGHFPHRHSDGPSAKPYRPDRASFEAVGGAKASTEWAGRDMTASLSCEYGDSLTLQGVHEGGGSLTCKASTFRHPRDSR